MKEQFIYKNIFLYASLQFCGHMDTYFISHTDFLIIYIINPRLKSKNNLLRIYKRGKLINEISVWSSENIFLYYASWYVHQLYFIYKYFNKKDPFILLSMHPIAYFGMSVVKIFRKITYVYWIGDYFPPTKLSLILFEKLKKFYHNRVDYRYYLSDKINRIINGTIRNDDTHKTVMWGLDAKSVSHAVVKNNLNLLFVGLIKEGQEFELLFSYISKQKTVHLDIIGICRDDLYKKYINLIHTYKINKQVFFPNKFYSDDELLDIARTSHIGVALYSISPLNAAYYTDPGKVKAYTEYRLPVIMSNTSEISAYVKKFHAGEVIKINETELSTGVQNIKNSYDTYLAGVDKFNRAFYYKEYYKQVFTFY